MTIRNLEWENHNSLRAFPFREGVSLLSIASKVQIPLDAALDFFAYVPHSGDETFYVSTIEVKDDFSVVLSVSGTSTGQGAGKVTVPTAFSPRDSFEFVGEGLGTAGKLVVGPGINIIRQWGVGVFEFTANAAQIEPSVIVPIDTGVVTSVGIEHSPTVLVGDVKIKAGRTIEIETIPEHNSLKFDGIKFIEDCTEERDGCPIQSINGVEPDDNGNIHISAEGIFKITSGSVEAAGAGITVSMIQGDDCPQPFLVADRGPDGDPGPTGPPGVPGMNTLCTGGICCECEICDTCEQCDLGALSPPRIIGQSPPKPMEGGSVTLTGTDLEYFPKPDEEWILCITWCTADGTSLQSPVTSGSFSAVETTVPAGLTTMPGPTADDNYCVRIKWRFGYTNPFVVCVDPAGGPAVTKLDTLDAFGPWIEIRSPIFLTLETVDHAEGVGAFCVSGILPTGGISLFSAAFDIFGAPPWDFSVYSTLGVLYVKEFDIFEGAPGDTLDLFLTDGTFASDVVSIPIAPAARIPVGTPLSSGLFVPITLPPIGGMAVDLTDIIGVDLITNDFATGVPVKAYYDCLFAV